jgi:hypothetical protein
MCPFCSEDLSSQNENDSSITFAVTDLIKDTAIAGNLSQNVVINKGNYKASGCPTCGSQNVPVMVCLSNDCKETFCDFCFKTPWVKIADINDISLPANSFCLIGERTNWGPFCKQHGDELINTTTNHRIAIVKEKFNVFDLQMSKLSKEIENLQHPILEVERGINQWSDILLKANAQYVLLTAMKMKIAETQQKQRKIELEKANFISLKAKFQLTSGSYIVGGILPFFLFYIGALVDEITFDGFSWFVILLLTLPLSFIILLGGEIRTEHWKVCVKNPSFFWPVFTFSYSLISILILWFSSSPENWSPLKSGTLVVYFVICLFTYALQLNTGVINVSFIRGRTVVKGLSHKLKGFEYHSVYRHDQEIMECKSQVEKASHDFKMFQPNSIPDTLLDPTDKIKSFKAIIEGYRFNLKSNEQKSNLLKSEQTSFELQAQGYRDGKQEYQSKMLGFNIL